MQWYKVEVAVKDKGEVALPLFCCFNTIKYQESYLDFRLLQFNILASNSSVTLNMYNVLMFSRGTYSAACTIFSVLHQKRKSAHCHKVIICTLYLCQFR